MKVKIVRIGNSQGIRLPKALLEQAGLGSEVDLKIRPGEIIIKATGIRDGWEEEARRLAASGEGEMLDPWIPTTFDEEEWQW
jgi:antitoxin MazE